MNILHVVGARPNFMKAAPLINVWGTHPEVVQFLVHTGQHYDVSMSKVFFQQLEMPAPDVNLNVGSGSHSQQTAEVMARLAPILVERKPDIVMVYGDVNSTLAAALVCAKLLIPVAHVEAGLRSFDRTMPEEINRLLTDQLCDWLFTPSSDANVNLSREGIPESRIHLVGNVMIDTLMRMLPMAEKSVPADLPEQYALLTLHRPSNVDDLPWLSALIAALKEVSCSVPIFFPVHPRTRRCMQEASLNGDVKLHLLDPLPYLDCLALQKRATLVITDSGGIQEETTFLGVPCLTIRENTERPITIEMGTNVLVGRDINRLRKEINRIFSGCRRTSQIPPLWDGCAADRIAAVITTEPHRVSPNTAAA